MSPPWEKHPHSAEFYWDRAEKVEGSAGDYENLSTNVWTAHGPARQGVAGEISGPINQVPPDVRREAFTQMRMALASAAGLRYFGDAVLIFDQEVDEINEQYANAQAHDFYVTETAVHVDPMNPPLLPPGSEDILRGQTIANLDKRYAELEMDLDEAGDEAAAMVTNYDPSEAEVRRWMASGVLPPAAAAVYHKYDFTDLPEFKAWEQGRDFPSGGEQRRTWATFFGPGPTSAQAVTAQVGEPGPDRGIIYGRYFISRNDAAEPADLLGDNRGFTSDANAPYRIAFAYDTATGEMSYTVSGSTTRAGADMDAREIVDDELPWTNTHPTVQTHSDGRITIDVHAVNPQTPAGAVDTQITIDPDQNYARLQGDDYPDFELYRQNRDGTTTEIGRDGMSPLDGTATLWPFQGRDEHWGGENGPSDGPVHEPDWQER